MSILLTYVAVKLPCSSKPCQNDGVCVNDVKNKTYTCTCKQPFFGINCEKGKYTFRK